MRHNRTEGVRYNRANSRIPAPDAFGQAPAERMAVHMLCDTCGRKKAAVFYHENIGGRVRTFNLCPACADAMKKIRRTGGFQRRLRGTGGAGTLPRRAGSARTADPRRSRDRRCAGIAVPPMRRIAVRPCRLRRGGMRGMLHGICRGACAAPADLRRAALSRGSRSGRLSCPAGAGGTCGGTPAGAGGGGRGRAF